LSRWREGQIIGLLGREFTEAIEGARWPWTSRMASSSKYCKAVDIATSALHVCF
jgi:hypothetical protein